MIVAPLAAPHHVDALRSGIDLAPTILEVLGVEGDPSFEGKSLVGEIYGGSAPERDVIVDLPMTSDSGRRRALVHGSEKLICVDTDSACQLFDLALDPMEKSPIVRGADFIDMKTRYAAVLKTIKEVAPYNCGSDCLNSAYRKKQQEEGQ
jgi:arylsulfatase A-like enzyme